MGKIKHACMETVLIKNLKLVVIQLNVTNQVSACLDNVFLFLTVSEYSILIAINLYLIKSLARVIH